MESSVNKSDYSEGNLIKESAKEELMCILESLPGDKELVFDSSLMKAFDKFAGYSFLKEHGGKVIKRITDKNSSEISKRIYIIRPTIENAQHICNHIKENLQRNIRCEYLVVMVSRILYVCERLFEREGIAGHINVTSFSYNLVPIDCDIFSLQLPAVFRDYHLEGNQSLLHTVASSIHDIQDYFGDVNNFHVLGECSQMVFEMSEKMRSKSGNTKNSHKRIDKFFIVDRVIDMVTPLCSQLTYEGLLDDIFTIDTGIITWDKQITTYQNGKFVLNSDDELYESIRNLHYTSAMSVLTRKVKKFVSNLDAERKDGVKGIKNIINSKMINNKYILDAHTMAASAIQTQNKRINHNIQIEYALLQGTDQKETLHDIEEDIHLQRNVTDTTRKLCLLSLTSGVNPTQYESLKRMFLQSYGYEYLVGLQRLQKLGLFTPRDPLPLPSSGGGGHLARMAAHIPRTSTFRAVCRKLHLIPKERANDISQSDDSDIGYIYGGNYRPMLCHFIDKTIEKGSLKDMEYVTELMGCPCSEKINYPVQDVKVVMVYFVGGCTYTEIAALRTIAKRRGIKITIATTHITSGSRIINDLIKMKTVA